MQAGSPPPPDPSTTAETVRPASPSPRWSSSRPASGMEGGRRGPHITRRCPCGYTWKSGHRAPRVTVMVKSCWASVSGSSPRAHMPARHANSGVGECQITGTIAPGSPKHGGRTQGTVGALVVGIARAPVQLVRFPVGCGDETGEGNVRGEEETNSEQGVTGRHSSAQVTVTYCSSRQSWGRLGGPGRCSVRWPQWTCRTRGRCSRWDRTLLGRGGGEGDHSCPRTQAHELHPSEGRTSLARQPVEPAGTRTGAADVVAHALAGALEGDVVGGGR